MSGGGEIIVWPGKPGFLKTVKCLKRGTRNMGVCSVTYMRTADGRKSPKNVWGNEALKVVIKRRRTLGSNCWELKMKLQKEDVWNVIEKRREKI